MSDAIKTPLRVLRTSSVATVRPWEPHPLHKEAEEPPAPTLAPRVTALKEAERILARAQEDASRILVDAREEAHELRQHAVEEGRREGRARVEAEREALLGELRPPLEAVLNELPYAWERFCLEQTPIFTELVVGTVEKILNAQLTLAPESVENIIRGALEHVPQDRQPHVRLHPDDLALLNVGRFENVTLQPDASLQRGGCRVESNQGTVDATIDGALLHLGEALRGEL